MKKGAQILLALGLAIQIALTGCAQTTPNPVNLSQPGDEQKSCGLLYQEMTQMQMSIKNSDIDANQQVTKNVALGVAGIFLIVPWFFMDLGHAPKIEGRAAQARLQKLQAIYDRKQCVVGQHDDGPSSEKLGSKSRS